MKRILFLLAALVVAVGLLLLADPADWLQASAEPQVPAEEIRPEAEPAAVGRTELPAATASDQVETAKRSRIEAGAEEVDSELAVLELRDESEEVQAGVILAVTRDGLLLHEGRTDSRGRAELEAADGEFEVYFAPSGRPVHRVMVPANPGLHRILLPAGETISGTVLDLSSGADRPEHIRLHSDHPLHPEWKLPDAARAALGLTWVRPGAVHGRIGEDGGFGFSGLPRDWSGELRIPGRALAEASAGRIAHGAWGLSLGEPVTGLRIRLAPRAVLRGVVLASQGEPVPKLELICRYERNSNDYALPSRFWTDEEGRFRVPLPLQSFSELKWVEIRLDPVTATEPVFHALGEEIPADGELGEIRISGGGELRFLLLDHRGRPLEGGRVSAAGVRAEPSGPDGHGVLQPLLDSAQRLRATAVGFVPASEPIPRPVPELLEIRLAPENRLEVSIPSLPVEARQNVGLSLAGDRGILAPESETNADLTDHTSFPEPWNTTFGPRGEITGLIAQMGGKNGAVFHALAPGVDLRLSLVGRFGDTVLQSVPVPALGASETRHLELELGGRLRVFRARVRNLEGELLVGARLQLSNQSFGETGEDGELLCLTTKIEPETLLISHESCATLYLKDFVAPADGAVVDFQLAPAYTVKVEVRDEDGALVPDCQVHYANGGFSTNARSLGDGRFVIRGLNAEPIRIDVRRKGRTISIDHDPAVPQVQITFPLKSGGKVEVRLRSETGFPEAERYSATLSSDGEGGEHLGIYIRRLDPRGFDFECVPPGEYHFRISYFPTQQEQADGMGSRQVIEPVDLTVIEGETTRLEVDVSAEMSPG